MSGSSPEFKPALLNGPDAAQQLQHGFAWLYFTDPRLERGFRENHFQQARSVVCTHFVLSILLFLSFIAIDEWILLRNNSVWLTSMRITGVCVLLACVVLTGARKLSPDRYPLAIYGLAPLFGLCMVGNELLDQPAGVSFVPTIVLTVFSLYLFIGMRFLPALIAGISVLLAYLLGARLVAAPLAEVIYNGAILAFTNVVGATAAYNLEKVQRTAYLEARLLTEIANRDGLTGIYNRRAFDDYLNRTWQQAARTHESIALLLLDIDHFKAFNDCYGHQAGDACLQNVAQVLASVTRRPLDLCARYGGEEFAVLLHNASREHVQSVASTIQNALRSFSIDSTSDLPLQPYATNPVTVSIGAACVAPQPARSSYGMVQLADEALYEAKAAGRNCIVIKDTEYAELTTGAFHFTPEQGRRLAS